MLAISSGSANRPINDVGRAVAKKPRSTSASVTDCCAASERTKVATPSDRVGPGRTLLTVTPVPRVRSARPRAMASWAVFVIP